VKYRAPHPSRVANDPANFDRITKIYREESQRKGLTSLEADFWEEVQRYIARLEQELASARAKDANSKAAMLLQDELRKVLQRRDQIYQFRERKISLLASQVVGGASAEVRGLTRTEQDLLHHLTGALAEARKTAFHVETMPAAPPPTSLSTGAPQTPTAPPSKPQVAREVVLRILEDVPPFAGPAGTLRLRKEDIVTLPPTIAKVLVDRGKARVVNPSS